MIEKQKPRLAASAVSRLDWHNQRSEFLARLNAKLDRAGDDAAREALLKQLSAELEAPLAPDQSAPLEAGATS